MMIKLRLATDCGIATLANAVNITYTQALQRYNQKNKGITCRWEKLFSHLAKVKRFG